ncbi:MAG: hypothetical protein HY859_08925 [Caulobacterales bacterium]|nr:hypothetical protein [Caulobacterales bacterium]
MRYEAPKKLSADEIEGILSREDVSPSERVKTVLSAIYYGPTIEYSGDILIGEFSVARYEEKIYLANLFETFHQMCRTNYRIDESLSLLNKYKQEALHNASEIEEHIEGLLELKEMMRGK